MAPTTDQIREIPSLLDGRVTSDQIDPNGHMNVAHFVAVCSAALAQLVRSIGLNDDYRARWRHGFFTAEHHVRYLSELKLDYTYSSRPQVVARSSSSVHIAVYLIDESNDRLACVMEAALVNVNMDTRRPEPLLGHMTEQLDRLLTSHRHDWNPVISGSIVTGARRTEGG